MGILEAVSARRLNKNRGMDVVFGPYRVFPAGRRLLRRCCRFPRLLFLLLLLLPPAAPLPLPRPRLPLPSLLPLPPHRILVLVVVLAVVIIVVIVVAVLLLALVRFTATGYVDRPICR